MKAHPECPLTALPINWVVALACEAKPLIQYYRLKKDLRSPFFNLYRNPQQNINLVVSGVGKVAMAAAVSFLQHYLLLNKQSIYLNIGIAGGQQHAIGSLWVANKVIEHATQRAFYPNVALLKAQSLSTVITFDQPQMRYPAVEIIDMEASAFFQTATLFVYQEYVHCMKIISDNQAVAIHTINPTAVTDLIQQQLTEIDAVSHALRAWLSANTCDIGVVSHGAELQQRWHFSCYQEQQLQQILRRWRVQLPTTNPLAIVEKAHSANAVLQQLTNYLENIAYYW